MCLRFRKISRNGRPSRVFTLSQSMLIQQLRKSDEIGLAFAIPDFRMSGKRRAG
jgi:hypothetical protein